MKLAVCMKWVPDPEYPFQASVGGVRLDAPGLTYLANQLDMVACETGIRLKETTGGTVTVVTVGPVAAESALRSGVAMGADVAKRIEFNNDVSGGSERIACLLASALGEDAPDVIVCGARSSDSGSGTVPIILAERLGRPLVANVTSLEGGDVLKIERRMDGGHRQLIQVSPPVVITVEESLCDPRYPSVVARHKAGRMTIDVRTPMQLGVDFPVQSISFKHLQGPRPLSARLVAPPPELGARGRLAYVLAGGPDQKRTPKQLDGPVPAVVDQLMAYLAANGVIGSEGRK